MKKLIIVLFLLLPSYAMAQGVTSTDIPAQQRAIMSYQAEQEAKAVKTAVSPSPKVEEKAKPVIIPNSKRQEWAIISLQLENAKLRAEAAVPAEIKKAVKDANDALDAFWKGVGVNPAELTAKWDISDGQNGDIILTPKKIEPPAKTP